MPSGREPFAVTKSATVGYGAVTATSVPIDGTMTVFSDGAVSGLITFRLDGSTEFTLPNNRTLNVFGFDPARLEVKGDVNYRVTVFGTVRQVGG